jgi:hypothetical protein
MFCTWRDTLAAGGQAGPRIWVLVMLVRLTGLV